MNIKSEDLYKIIKAYIEKIGDREVIDYEGFENYLKEKDIYVIQPNFLEKANTMIGKYWLDIKGGTSNEYIKILQDIFWNFRAMIKELRKQIMILEKEKEKEIIEFITTEEELKKLYEDPQLSSIHSRAYLNVGEILKGEVGKKRIDGKMVHYVYEKEDKK